MWTYKSTKDTFIGYFTQNNHLHIPPSSLLPESNGNADNSILFTNSGMVQFKNIFMGESTDTVLACNSQPCIRAGGKHNDLDDVGKDSYHHTYFEMLGSWSFNYNSTDTDSVTPYRTEPITGDVNPYRTEPNANTIKPYPYFKKQAIYHAWNLLVNIYGLDKNKIYVTYFGGFGDIDADTETRDIWLQYLPADRIIPFGMKDNFWEMGETGPCGPCTEIHYDKLGRTNVADLVNTDNPTVIEVWNLVFMQYNRTADSTLLLLDKKHVDTGMGLERLVAIMQNTTNYQIDLFKDIMAIIQRVTGSGPYKDLYADSDPNFINMAYRVVADHCRTLCFAICDGIVSGHCGRQYVVKKIIRRALYFVYKLKDEVGILTAIIDQMFDLLIGGTDDHGVGGFNGLSDLVTNNTIDNMGNMDNNTTINNMDNNTVNNTINNTANNTTNNTTKKDIINRIINNEEKNFRKILVKGKNRFLKAIENPVDLTKKLFQISITIGLPVDHINLLCAENNIDFDAGAFDELMNQHKEISKKKPTK